MNGCAVIPNRLLNILRSCENDATSHFPPTEIYNEGWMLRLVLDAVQTLDLHDHPLQFLQDARWYAEAQLISPFRPRSRTDKLAEAFTHADGVIGHFDFSPSTKAGLELRADAKQFVVIEAKMFSNLSAGTKNAPLYDQAARNVACMAEAIFRSGKSVIDLERLGFFVLAPVVDKRRHRSSNLEALIDPNSIRRAVTNRIKSYESASRSEAAHLRDWEQTSFLPLVERLTRSQCLAVLSWEDCIEAIRSADRDVGDELNRFYERCLTYAPQKTLQFGTDGD